MGTAMPSAASVAAVWARANRTLQPCTTVRRGCGIATTVPRSGQVPTTTTLPASRSLLTARRSRCADASTECFLVTSLAPTKITAASGGGPATNIASTCPASPLEVAPEMALVLNRIRRPVASASPRASRTPSTSSAVAQPTPAAVESPKIMRCRSNGTPMRQGAGSPHPAV